MNLLPTDSADNHEEIPHHTSKPHKQGREMKAEETNSDANTVLQG